MTDTLTPVERTNWMLLTRNSTLDRNDVPSAWLYGQDLLWATQDLVSSVFTETVTYVHLVTTGNGFGL